MSPVEAGSTSLYDDAIQRMLVRIEDTAAAIGSAFPLSADPETGVWATSPDGRWTGGFWAGSLWLAWHAAGAERFRGLALDAMHRLESRLPIDNVLNGLVFYYGAAVGARVGGSDRATKLAVQGARALAGRFVPAAGFIPLGHQSGSLTADANGETNIDGVPGMSLLYWAAEATRDTALRDIASQHVKRHIELCQRPDGSLHQAALVDPGSGVVLRQYSPRGHAHDSAWARAQSWGMLGFAQAYAWTGDRYIGDAAMRLADWWLDAVPEDRVAFWDFRDPAIPETERDTSATAMVAGTLLKLGRIAPTSAQRERYTQAGTETVDTLVKHYLTPTHAGDARARGILTEGCWQHNEGMATRHELVWGDYYLLEALLMLAGKLEGTL